MYADEPKNYVSTPTDDSKYILQFPRQTTTSDPPLFDFIIQITRVYIIITPLHKRKENYMNYELKVRS